MIYPPQTRSSPPHGLSFAVDDLMTLQNWAALRGLAMEVDLGQVVDGAEFEEVVRLSVPARRRQVLTFWRTSGAIAVLASGRRPRAFPTLAQALESVEPTRRLRPSWFSRIV
jgi:hypothetical protein